MTTRSAEEPKREYEQRMGDELGAIFYALVCEVAALHERWSDYVSIFGTNENRIVLLNRAAPGFFARIQDTMWDDVLLRVARLTDDPQSPGAQRTNLSLKQLPRFLLEPELKAQVSALSAELRQCVTFCRDWRNRRLAHSDLRLSISGNARPLEPASRRAVNDALETIGRFLSLVSAHYTGSSIAISADGPGDDSYELLCLIDDGLRERENRDARVNSGIHLASDVARRDF